MLRVLTKFATYIEGLWHAAGTEIQIAEKHFAEEVHTLLGKVESEFGESPQAVPPAPETAPPHPPAESPEPAVSAPKGEIPSKS